MSDATTTATSANPLPKGLEEVLLLRDFEKFVTHELELLDGRAFEEWRDLFAEDGHYWVPSRIDQENANDEVSLFNDDREIMDTRFQRLRHPQVHAQIPHSRTTHVIGNFVIDDADDKTGTYAFSCRFIALEYRPEIEQRAFGGRYEYRVIREGESFKIKAKKATLINCDASHFPISIPL